MVRFRLDRRLYGRIDPADVLQDAYLEVARRIEQYVADPPASFFVWARQITWQTLLMTHRRHLGAKRRDAGREVHLQNLMYDNTTSLSLAAQLIGQLTSPSQAAVREERCRQLHESLEAMEDIDREVLVLRHFEHLGNNEIAEILGIGPTAASNRYIRALKRLRDVVCSLPDLMDELDRSHGPMPCNRLP
jgi:RNA polymerase sigma-70 factor (ECF subfamily)